MSAVEIRSCCCQLANSKNISPWQMATLATSETEWRLSHPVEICIMYDNYVNHVLVVLTWLSHAIPIMNCNHPQ